MSRVAAVTPSTFERIAAAAPDGIEVRRLETPGDLEGAGFVVPTFTDPEILAALSDVEGLEVVQALSAGTDWLEEHVPEDVTLCNASGARDAPVAEWVLAALLGAATGLLTTPRDGRWERWEPRELYGSTVLVLGLGSIGGAVAERLEPFGVRVVGVASRPRDGVHGVDELPQLLPEADALVVLTPLTDATHGLVDAAALAALPDGALVLNAGRGPIIDPDALVAELQTGRLRAVLDVTDPEPLPPDHPLWSTALAITPHVSGDTAPALDRAADLAAAQIGRWSRGEPLANVVDG